MRFGDIRQFAFRHDTGRATIPDELRAQIDQAVAEGRVTCVPRGVSGLPYGVYDPEAGIIRLEGGPWIEINARMRERAEKAKAQRQARDEREKEREQKRAESQERAWRMAAAFEARRLEVAKPVAELRQYGVGGSVIAARLGMSRRTVQRCLAALREVGFAFPPAIPTQHAKYTDGECLAALFLQREGMTYAGIAAVFKGTKRQVGKMIKRARRIERDRQGQAIAAE